MTNKMTTIKISKKTLSLIKKHGYMGETYEDVILKLLKNVKNKIKAGEK